MSTRCSEFPFSIGCKDGQQFCKDSRCFPSCPDCQNDSTSSDWIIVLIILILAGVLLVMGIITGFDYYNKTKKAVEPKSVTLHKHVQQIIPPAVISPIETSVTTDDFSLKSCPSSRFSDDFTLRDKSRPPSSQILGFE